MILWRREARVDDEDFVSATLGALAQGAPEGDEVALSISTEALGRLCAGHFPGAPVVPGAYLLACLQDLAARVDPAALVVERCVFRAQVTPDRPARAVARRQRDGRVRGEVCVLGADKPAVIASFTHAV